MRFLSLFFTCALAAATAVAQEAPATVPNTQDEPSGELTLQQAVALATSRNPEVAAAQSEVRAREGRMLQAGVRPNPELSGTSENLGGDEAKTGGVQSTLQVGQRLELGGDRAARIAAATAARDLARWDLEARRIEVAGRATRAFVNLLAAQRRVELADQTVRLTEEVRNTVAARVEAGKVSPIEETRADVALSTERIELNYCIKATAQFNADWTEHLDGTWRKPASSLSTTSCPASLKFAFIPARRRCGTSWRSRYSRSSHDRVNDHRSFSLSKRQYTSSGSS